MRYIFAISPIENQIAFYAFNPFPFQLDCEVKAIVPTVVYSPFHTKKDHYLCTRTLNLMFKVILPEVSFAATAAVKDLIYKGVCQLKKVIFHNLDMSEKS